MPEPLDYGVRASRHDDLRKVARFSLRIAPVLLIIALIGLRIYRSYRPANAAVYPSILSICGQVDGGTYEGPNGVKLRIVFIDCGAAHSGRFYTWVIRDHIVLGPRVIAQGWSDPQVAMLDTPLPMTWHDDGSFTVQFMTARSGPGIPTKVTAKP